MFTKNLKPVLLALLLCVMVPKVSAEPTGKYAEIIVANERTQTLIAEKNYAAALDNAEAAYELSLNSFGEKDRNTANLAVVYARLLGPTGQRHKALQYFKRAVAMFSDLYGDDSILGVPAMLGLAEYISKDKQPGIVKAALDIKRTEDPEDKLGYADSALYAGGYLVKHEVKRDFAIEILNEALEIYAQEYGNKSAELVQPLLLLGNASAKFGNSRLAKKHYRRALKISEQQLSEEEQARVLRQVGSALLVYSGSPDAKKYLKRSYRMFSDLYGEDDIRTAMSGLEMARYHLANKKPYFAVPLLIKTVEALEELPNYRNYQLSALSLLVEAYEAQGKRDEATPYCQAIGQIAPWTDTQDYLPIFKKAPEYPSSAIQARSEGYVIVEYTVDENGFVTEPHIIESTGHRSFHAVSLKAAEGFRYASAYDNGEAVATSGVRNKFTFAFR